ncbi:MAG TPA: ATP-binding cassette domain-containing protein [Kiritimatiellae bacterium]|nr:ATP-binding cassette domain-containing protein [Kiritimatiellia bacterium]
MLEVKNIRKAFGGRVAVDGVSFAVERGTVLGFLGPNGAGKTTTMRIIAGYLLPDAGSVSVLGTDAVAAPVAVQRQIGYLPENTPLYGEMTVEEFLDFIGEVRGFHGRDKRRRIAEIVEQCFLEPVRHQTIDTLSKGYRQRTCFAQAIFHDPPVLLLDEPTEGLDPNQKQVVRDMIRRMGQQKIILLSTHILEEVEAVCSRAIIISRGRIVADSTPDELRRRSIAYNAATVKLGIPAAQAEAELRQLPALAEFRILDRDHGTCTVYLRPGDGRPLAPEIHALACEKKWPLMDVHTDPGDLSEVFRRITVTEDTRSTARAAAP